MEEEAFSVLSPELLEALGGGANFGEVLLTKKHKSNSTKEEYVPEETLKEAKKLSKRAKKKIEQIQVKL